MSSKQAAEKWSMHKRTALVRHMFAAVRRAKGCAYLRKLERRKRLRRAKHGVRGGPVALGHARGVAARRARV